MDTRLTFRRITLYVVGASVVMTALSFALGGATMGVGAAVGGALAVGNWMLMRWVGRRLMVANDKGRMVWGGLLAFKMVLLMAVAWGILATGWVDPMGFTVGLSGLVLGILVGAFHSATTADPGVGEPSSEEN